MSLEVVPIAARGLGLAGLARPPCISYNRLLPRPIGYNFAAILPVSIEALPGHGSGDLMRLRVKECVLFPLGLTGRARAPCVMVVSMP